MKKNPVTIKVSPEFRSFLKSEAALKGKSIIELTKDIAKGKTNKDENETFKFKF